MSAARAVASSSPARTASSAATSSSGSSPTAPASARSASTTRAARRAGSTTHPAETRAALDVRLGDIRDARFVEARDRGRRDRLPPRGADRDPVLLRRRRVVHRHERPRHAQRPRGRPAGRRRAVHPDLDERGLRHAGDAARSARRIRSRPSRRTRRRRSAADQLALAFHRSSRPAGDGPAAVQHLRAAPVGAGGAADDAPPAPGRAAARSTSVASTPRRDLTFVADTVDGFVRAATAPGIEGRTIQLGTGRSESIGELFDIACRSDSAIAGHGRSRTPTACGRTRAR